MERVVSVVTVDELVELAGDVGVLARRGYSGRGMYGAECFAVEGTHRDFARFMAALPDDVAEELAEGVSMDQMGREWVWYWRRLQTRPSVWM